jgi:pSer/pThr/pTyr-binding forkhead associated (FHA) protein
MPKILISKEQNKIEEMAVTEGTVTIGRNKDNDIQIDDPSVSAYHAKLVSFFKPTYIQDLRSTNGTYVNGRRIMEHTLQDSDVITIGKHSIIYKKDDATVDRDNTELTIELSAQDISLILKATRDNKTG